MKTWKHFVVYMIFFRWFLRSAGGGDLWGRHSGPRQQPAEEDHRPTDGPLRLQEGTDRRDDPSQTGLRRR